MDCAAVVTMRTSSTKVRISRAGTRNWRAYCRYSAVACCAMGLSRKIGRLAGIKPFRFNRCSTSSSACALPTAKVGISTEPPRRTVSSIKPANAAMASVVGCCLLP